MTPRRMLTLLFVILLCLPAAAQGQAAFCDDCSNWQSRWTVLAGSLCTSCSYLDGENAGDGLVQRTGFSGALGQYSVRVISDGPDPNDPAGTDVTMRVLKVGSTFYWMSANLSGRVQLGKTGTGMLAQIPHTMAGPWSATCIVRHYPAGTLCLIVDDGSTRDSVLVSDPSPLTSPGSLEVYVPFETEQGMDMRADDICFTPLPPVLEPCPYYASDANCDGSVDVLDVVETINCAFRGATLKTPCCSIK